MGTISRNNIKLALKKQSIPVRFTPAKNLKEAEDFARNTFNLKRVNYSLFSLEDCNLINSVLFEEYTRKPFILKSIEQFNSFERDEEISTYMMVYDFHKPLRSSLLINPRNLYAVRPKNIPDSIEKERFKRSRILDELELLESKKEQNKETIREKIANLEDISLHIEDFERLRNEFKYFLISDQEDNRDAQIRSTLIHEIAHIRQNNRGKMGKKTSSLIINILKKLPDRSAYPKVFLLGDPPDWESYRDEKIAELYSLYVLKPDILTPAEHKFIKRFFNL